MSFDGLPGVSGAAGCTRTRRRTTSTAPRGARTRCPRRCPGGRTPRLDPRGCGWHPGGCTRVQARRRCCRYVERRHGISDAIRSSGACRERAWREVMYALRGKDLTQRSSGCRTSRLRRVPLAAALLALLVLCCLFGAAASAGAATPGRPTAKAPKGTITTTRPTFKWSKAPRAAKYELRVYKGSKLQLRKTGLTKLSWKSSRALPKKVSLTWKVRARNARCNGAWSRSLKFKIVTGSPAKAITAFSFQGLSPPVTGTVTEAAHTMALTVPFGTNVS